MYFFWNLVNKYYINDLKIYKISTQNYIWWIMNKNHVLYLKNADVQELFIQASKRPKIKTLMYLQYYAGLRISEALAITPNDFDLDDRFIKVVNGKGNKDRVIPLFPRLAEHLAGLDIASRRKPLIKMGRSNAIKRYKDIYQECLDNQKITKYINLGSHTLRHSAIIHWLNIPLPVNRVQSYAGHSSIQTTQAYTRLTPEDAIDLSGIPVDTSEI